MLDDSQIEDLRRRLVQMIVSTGAYGVEYGGSLHVTVTEREQLPNGKTQRSRTTLINRKPTARELETIARLARVYLAAVNQRNDSEPEDDEDFGSLMEQRDVWDFGGRKAAELATGDDDEAGDAADVRSPVEMLQSDLYLVDLLTHDGWSIVDLATGENDGRKPITEEHETRSALSKIAPLPELHRILGTHHKRRTPKQAKLYRALPNVLHHLSPRVAAKSLSCSESTVEKLKKKSKEDAEVTEVLEELRALRAEVAEVREDAAETRQDAAETRRLAVETAERIRERFPTDAEVSFAVDELIASIAA
jgi:hypothetical protein